jgi:hypothetical protein
MSEFTNHELPPCPWYPNQLCPGECQYILPEYACIHEPRVVTCLADPQLDRLRSLYHAPRQGKGAAAFLIG